MGRYGLGFGFSLLLWLASFWLTNERGRERSEAKGKDVLESGLHFGKDRSGLVQFNPYIKVIFVLKPIILFLC
jgi:hypothetical protein